MQDSSGDIVAIFHPGIAGMCPIRCACKTGVTVAAVQAVLSTHPAGILDMEPKQHSNQQRHQTEALMRDGGAADFTDMHM